MSTVLSVGVTKYHPQRYAKEQEVARAPEEHQRAALTARAQQQECEIKMQQVV